MNLFTIGHSNRTIEDFISVLQECSINILFDVRRFPSSQKYPHFNQKFMQKQLQNSGIEYQFFGEELGGFRKGGYAQFIKSELFQKGITKLIQLSRQKTGCLMCAESNYSGCHRRFIADFLSNKSITVTHILDKNQKTIHSVSLL